MNSLWNDNEVADFKNDPLALRVYTSRLLGREPSLVLHGGGNTSVKAGASNIFGESEELLYVKGSGWDLATIESQGFAPVKMDVLLKMAKLDQLTDAEMVRVQRTAMTDPSAPTPSVEAILHAIIPFKFVDHTHADAVVTVTNTENGERYIREIYGDRVLVVPYVMPGFILAKKIYEMTKDVHWDQYEGMILMNHGAFTFDNDAKKSYERMIQIVTEAENFLRKRKILINSQDQGSKKPLVSSTVGNLLKRFQHLVARQGKGKTKLITQSIQHHLLKLAQIRLHVSRKKGAAVLAKHKASEQDIRFSNSSEISSVANRGPLTPDHVIRTKRTPVIIGEDAERDVGLFSEQYRAYFSRHAGNNGLTCLDQAPRWAVWPGKGTIAFGGNVKELTVISDIIDHTVWAIEAAEILDHWKALPEKDIFDVEYWELEQAKLKKGGSGPVFKGKVAIVTGAASGIGRACVEKLHAQGAVVAALDINPDIGRIFQQEGILGLVCDLTKEEHVRKSIEAVIAQFGGLDILVSNAGIFPAGESIENVSEDTWRSSMDINLSSHQRLLKQSIPFLSLGIDPSIIIVASKNVPAPGPGASAYSVAKAGLTQLARVAALELGPKGVRVNVVHPNQVFDTAIWTDEILTNRAQHYGMSVDEYKKNNLLKAEITSQDVAQLVCTMASPVFGKTTGAQIPIDGGNERVI